MAVKNEKWGKANLQRENLGCSPTRSISVPSHKPIICAHRGLAEQAPENTLAAFRRALRRGMAIEVDLRSTADDQLVIMHDETLDRTTDGSGPVQNFTLDEIKSLDAGAWFSPYYEGERVPTLEETLDLVKELASTDISLLVEVKSLEPDIVRMLIDQLSDAALFSSTLGIGLVEQSVDVRRRFNGVSPDFQCSVRCNTAAQIPAAVADPTANWVYGRWVPESAEVKHIHKAGCRLIGSGLDVIEKLDCAATAMESGADVVITSHPLELESLEFLIRDKHTNRP